MAFLVGSTRRARARPPQGELGAALTASCMSLTYSELRHSYIGRARGGARSEAGSTRVGDDENGGRQRDTRPRADVDLTTAVASAQHRRICCSIGVNARQLVVNAFADSYASVL